MIEEPITEEWLDGLPECAAHWHRFKIDEHRTLIVSENELGIWYLFFHEIPPEGVKSSIDMVTLMRELRYKHELRTLYNLLTGKIFPE